MLKKKKVNNELSNEELKVLNGYFRALNYLSVGQLYLLDNPLLERKLLNTDLKPRIVGHFGTAPGQNFVYMHLNRIIKKYNLNMMYICGPGHGGQVLTSNAYLEGVFSDYYTDITQDKEGLRKLFKMFSFPGGTSSHASPEIPGSIHEGGELGYSLSHAFGAVLDNPNLIVACMIGDGEAETAPLCGSWWGSKILNPKTDGIVLPILHLNGYKISNPTILSRIPEHELENYFKGMGYKPYIVQGSDINYVNQELSKTLDEVIQDIKDIWKNRCDKKCRPTYPMIIFKSPKGWTAPKLLGGKQIENSFRSHQVPIVIDRKNIQNLEELEKWMKRYKINELFEDGKLLEEYKTFLPEKEKLMSMNKNTNGGLLLKDLILPNINNYGLKKVEIGKTTASDMMELGSYLRDIIKLNPDNFKIFGPDEAMSNRLNHIFDETNRKWNLRYDSKDEYLSPDGKIIDSALSEHLCEGMLEGYILTGRHGIMHSYEAFIRIVDSMTGQHAKWLKMSKEIPWRKEISSLNYILTSHIWQQDHNGYTHQDPGFLNHLVTKKGDITRIYLPIDANTLINVTNHILQTKNYINVIVASKHISKQWLGVEESKKLCAQGIGELEFASNCKINPDVIFACAGDTPTLEVLVATSILRKNIKNIKIRVISIIDLMKLQSNKLHPHGLSDEEFDKLFTKNKKIIFNFHGYPILIKSLIQGRNNQNISIHGYEEEGTITTSFDMRVRNKIDRFTLVLEALKEIEDCEEKENLKKWCEKTLKEHKNYIKENGCDLDIISDWTWDL